MKLKYILIGLIAIALLNSCKSKKRAAEKNNKTKKEVILKQDESKVDEIISKRSTKSSFEISTVAYINKYKDIAMEEMKKYKIPASITLAQGILESRSGNSELTLKSNNHFGIKCHTGWSGKKVYHDDDSSGECFRKYKDPRTSFEDHSLFLVERKRYSKLFRLKQGDYEAWAQGLSEAGYATDRRYPAKLIGLIEKYDLHKFDTQVLGKPFEREIVKKGTDNSTKHIVVKGDTLYSISKKYGLTVDELKRLNGLTSNNIDIGQTLILK